MAEGVDKELGCDSHEGEGERGHRGNIKGVKGNSCWQAKKRKDC